MRWKEEYIPAERFPSDGEGNKIAIDMPLKSEWLKQSTGMWLKVWGVGNGGSDYIMKGEVWTQDGFEGMYGSPSEFKETIVNVLNFDGSESEPSSFTLEHWNLWTECEGAKGAFASRRLYEFPGTGAKYAGLTLRVSPQPFEEETASPDWAAARVWYRVEG
jgi:hypothetical protein